jgi:hypothetical protein
MPRDWDDEDDDRPRRRRRDEPDELAGINTVIPFRNGMALTSYYCGVFGLISCFIFGVGGLFGVVPVILGILGLIKARQDPKASGSVHAWVGIALGMLEVLTGCGTIGVFSLGLLQDRGR